MIILAKYKDVRYNEGKSFLRLFTFDNFKADYAQFTHNLK